MNNEIYTIGYTGRTPEEIGIIVRNLNAFLLDIRLHARSRSQSLLTLWGEVAA